MGAELQSDEHTISGNQVRRRILVFVAGATGIWWWLPGVCGWCIVPATVLALACAVCTVEAGLALLATAMGAFLFAVFAFCFLMPISGSPGAGRIFIVSAFAIYGGAVGWAMARGAQSSKAATSHGDRKENPFPGAAPHPPAPHRFRFTLFDLMAAVTLLSLAGYAMHEWRVVKSREEARKQLSSEAASIDENFGELTGVRYALRRRFGDERSHYFWHDRPLSNGTEAKLRAHFPEAIVGGDLDLIRSQFPPEHYRQQWRNIEAGGKYGWRRWRQ